MQTRRVFLKMLFGVVGLALPWTSIDTKIKLMIDPLMGQPKAKLYVVPPEPQTINEYFQSSSLDKNAMDDIEALSAPEMEGRRAGRPGEGKASQYITRELNLLGLSPMGEGDKSFTQAFTIPDVREVFVGGRLTFAIGNPDLLRSPSLNILGGIKGKIENECILISAHYDHLGIYEDQVYYGANDNASGVGVVLDVIRRIVRENVAPQKTLIFAFWSAEEMGFLGSKYFVANPTIALEGLQAVINVDTVGNGVLGDFGLWTKEATDSAAQIVQQAAAEAGASATVVNPNGHNSDQSSFYSKNVPAVTLLSKSWLEDNHSVGDTSDQVRAEQVQLAADVVYRAAQKLAF